MSEDQPSPDGIADQAPPTGYDPNPPAPGGGGEQDDDSDPPASSHSSSSHSSSRTSTNSTQTSHSSSSTTSAENTESSSSSKTTSHSESNDPSPTGSEDDPGVPTSRPAPWISFITASNGTASFNASDLTIPSSDSEISTPAADQNKSQPVSDVVTDAEVLPSPTEDFGLPTSDPEAFQGQSGFLQNRGGVAGLFTVVGIIAASLLICGIWYIRRRRRIRREKQWLDGVQALPDPDDSDDPFKDPFTQPNMTEREHDATYTLPDQYGYTTNNTNANPFHGAFDHFGLQAQRPPERIYPDNARQLMTPSVTPSSPSVYAATLPMDERNDGQWQTINVNQKPAAPPKSYQPEAPEPQQPQQPPPRPPRSLLRDLTKTEVAFPDTPPASTTSSHSSSDPPSPEYETKRRISSIIDEMDQGQQYISRTPHAILARPTLLDVRPRKAQV